MKLLTASSLGIPPAQPGFDTWMQRVLDRADKISPDWDAEDIHDLRTAIRRCRAMAEALDQVNPDRSWRKVRHLSRTMFHSMGGLRDPQVGRHWVKKLSAPGNSVRKHLLRALSREEASCKSAAKKALDDFDGNAWRKLTKRLSPKASLFPLESIVFQRLALARLNDAVALYQRARKHPSGAAWHRVRIALKHFRYLIENFLPQRYEVWSKDLKHFQDILGEVHDLDVLRASVRRESAKFKPELIQQWNERIAAERKTRLNEFIRKTSGPDSPWLEWRAAFRWGSVLHTVPMSERRSA